MIAEDQQRTQSNGRVAEPVSRRLNLRPWLDGTHQPPLPSVGAVRTDNVHMLYPARWHTVIALTTAGKSWLGLWHCLGEMTAGNAAAYLHFEETDPGATLERLLLLGATPDQIESHFIWLTCDRRWDVGQLAVELATLSPQPSLVILDGINAACSQHGWDTWASASVGSYRRLLVAPATRLGAAVLSLGHPPKARDRQDERHGFGSTGWLDEVDGVGFRMIASNEQPIGRSRKGHSLLYTVKDRPGQVERHGRIDPQKEAGWHFMGTFELDNSNEKTAHLALRAPSGDRAPDKVDTLANEILFWLVRTGGRFESKHKLADTLRAKKVKFNENDLGAALLLLEERGTIVWPSVPAGRPRPGWASIEVQDEN